MVVDTVKMSSKGQIVIPQDIRKNINAEEGTIFAVVENKDSVILKKLETPSKEELIKDLKIIAKQGSKRVKKLGIKEKDIPNLVHKTRK